MAAKLASDHAKFLVTELLKTKVNSVRNAKRVSKTDGGAPVTTANFAFTQDEIDLVQVLTGVAGMAYVFKQAESAGGVEATDKPKSKRGRKAKAVETPVTVASPVAPVETPVTA